MAEKLQDTHPELIENRLQELVAIKALSASSLFTLSFSAGQCL